MSTRIQMSLPSLCLCESVANNLTPPNTKMAMGNPPFSIANTSSNGGFSIAMLVFGGVRKRISQGMASQQIRQRSISPREPLKEWKGPSVLWLRRETLLWCNGGMWMPKCSKISYRVMGENWNHKVIRQVCEKFTKKCLRGSSALQVSRPVFCLCP